ncbi:MAG: S46 family peptidase [Candidatus Cryptobacteroides sp.]
MKRVTIILIAILSCLNLSADEGMWIIHAIDSALEKKMQERGLTLNARDIYDAEAEGATISDAVVSLDFGCTGSIISDNGLVITNHHCAYSDVHALSTPEHNYLEEGFWAMKSEEEIHIPHKSIYILKKVIDVTDEVASLSEDLNAKGKPFGLRKLSFILEKKYSEASGLKASLSSYWAGSKYYMALYQVYDDIRLVAAPPVSMAAFGGDIDNWEWPQHKCDFAMYRIYTAPDGSPAGYSPDNIQMKPARRLQISLEGYKPGDFTMVIGYPGRTNRYCPGAEIEFKEKVTLPISTTLRREQMEIINRWMNEDPDIRLKYSDYYFSLSNFQELGEGEALCFRRFDVAGHKRQQDKEVEEWARSKGMKRWATVADQLSDKYAGLESLETSRTYYRETFVRGTRIGLILRRAFNSHDEKGLAPYILKDYDEIDLRVEKDLTVYSIIRYMENVDSCFFSDIQKAVMKQYRLGNGGYDFRKMAEDLWESSLFTSEEGIARLMANDVTHEEIVNDPLCAFMMSVRITDFNSRESEIEGKDDIRSLSREYTKALYRMREDKGEAQYPDANSTMRISYGTVCTIEPKDGVICGWSTTPAGILEKYDPDSYEFSLSDRQLQLYKEADWGKWGFTAAGGERGMYVDFLTDNDITGGNSGSPVLDSKGRLIGLAFDGNKESLASDAAYIPQYNRCVCVDIRFILWTLDRYAGMSRILEEIGL